MEGGDEGVLPDSKSSGAEDELPPPPPAPLQLTWNEHELEQLYNQIANISAQIKSDNLQLSSNIETASLNKDQLEDALTAKEDEIRVLVRAASELQLSLDEIKEAEIRLLEDNTMQLQGKLDHVKDNIAKVDDNFEDVLRNSRKAVAAKSESDDLPSAPVAF
uniref:Uncharacterized protein n=1 Tax=Alexandrium andersonii TaxID=327968 RepID=A0A7S2N4R5_9DINO